MLGYDNPVLGCDNSLGWGKSELECENSVGWGNSVLRYDNSAGWGGESQSWDVRIQWGEFYWQVKCKQFGRFRTFGLFIYSPVRMYSLSYN